MSISRTSITQWPARLGASLLAAAALAGPAPVPAATLKIAALAPDGSSWMEGIRAGANEVAERTGGRVELRFYPGGVMGDDTTVLRKVRVGQLQGGVLTTGLDDILDEMQLYMLPMTFQSNDEVDFVRERLDATLERGLADKGFVSLGFAETGFGYLMSIEPIRSVADLKGRKVWLPEGDRVSLAVLEDVGVSPVPLTVPDVLTGLQTGLIDTVVISPLGALALQWHTRVKYVTEMPIAYIYGGLLVDARAYGKLAEADRAVLSEVMRRVIAELAASSREGNESARATLVRQGITFVEPAAGEAERLRAAAARVLDRLGAEGFYSAALLAEMRAHLAEFRARAGRSN